jgi:acetylglutamate kinase
VRTARVIDGRVKHSILLEIFTNEGIGTMVVPDETESSASTSTVRMEAAA